MAPSKFTGATLLYTTKGKVRSKKVPLPQKRHAPGILNVFGGYVEICWFRVPPEIGGYQNDNFQIKRVPIPMCAGVVGLKVGGVFYPWPPESPVDRRKMAESPSTEATLTYTVKGKAQSKKILIPARRHALGILSQWGGYVEICWFRVPPEIGGYQNDNFQIKKVRVPLDAGLATLWVGGRVV